MFQISNGLNKRVLVLVLTGS